MVLGTISGLLGHLGHFRLTAGMSTIETSNTLRLRLRLRLLLKKSRIKNTNYYMTFKVLVNWCKKETWKLQTGCHVIKLTYPIFFRFLNSPNERGEREMRTRSMLCSGNGKKQTKYFFNFSFQFVARSFARIHGSRPLCLHQLFSLLVSKTKTKTKLNR